MSTDHLIDRPAYATQCPRCKERVLVAMDGGLSVTTDVIPASINAEIAAWLTKRYAWEIIRDPYPGQTHLRFRGLARIKAGRDLPVVLAHECPDGTRPVIPWHIPPPRPSAPKAPAVTTDGTVPF